MGTSPLVLIIRFAGRIFNEQKLNEQSREKKF